MLAKGIDFRKTPQSKIQFFIAEVINRFFKYFFQAHLFESSILIFTEAKLDQALRLTITCLHLTLLPLTKLSHNTSRGSEETLLRMTVLLIHIYV